MNLKQIFEKSFIGVYLLFILIFGGQPMSGVCYSALEVAFDEKLPTHNISDLLNIMDHEDRITSMRKEIAGSKIEVKTIAGFKDLLLSEGVTTIPISTEDEVVILRVEQRNHVQKLKKILSEINTTNDLHIYVEYLNEEEAIIRMAYKEVNSSCQE